jgi:hypothetical protein
MLKSNIELRQFIKLKETPIPNTIYVNNRMKTSLVTINFNFKVNKWSVRSLNHNFLIYIYNAMFRSMEMHYGTHQNHTNF